MIIKPHPNLFIYEDKKINELRDKIKNVKMLEKKYNYDVTKLSQVCDMAICDISGSTYEFLASNKPILFFDNKNIKEDQKYLFQAAEVLDVTDLSSLKKSVELSLTTDPHRNTRLKLIEEALYKVDGLTCTRIYERILKDFN